MKRCFASVLMIVLASGLIVGGFAQPQADASDAADFFKNNVVTVVVGYSPGGGSDYSARLLASYWSDATDGGAMVVKNMPGAAGLMATNYLYAAKPDGRTIEVGMALSSYVMPIVAKDPAAKFDAKKLNWLIGVFEEPWVIHVSVKRPYETLEDLKEAKGLKIGTVSPYASSSFINAAFIDILGLDARMVSGYKGGSAMSLAGAKGEIDLIPQPASTGWDAVKKGFLKPPVVIMGRKRVPFFPDTPTFPELVKMTPEQEKEFRKAVTATYILRTAAAGPGVPEDRVQFMRDAFKKVVAMKGFQTQAKLQFPLGPTPMMGEELNDFMNEALSLEIGPLKAQIKSYLAIK